MIKYSIIIATYNRIDELRELLSSADRMVFPVDHFEIVIVDDGSTDATEGFITNYDASYDIQYLSQQNKGPGEARNHGMTKAKGKYFLFVDSDCMFPPEYLSKIDTHLLAYPLDAFGGPDTYHPSFSDLLKAINYSMTSFLGTGGTRGASDKISKFYPRSFNMGIKREIFDSIGGMNQLRHGQDMDFSLRIYNARYKVGLIPNAFVYHKEERV